MGKFTLSKYDNLNFNGEKKCFFHHVKESIGKALIAPDEFSGTEYSDLIIILLKISKEKEDDTIVLNEAEKNLIEKVSGNIV